MKQLLISFFWLIICLVIIKPCYSFSQAKPLAVIRPLRLHRGDTVALISSASRALTDQDIDQAKKRLQALGLKVKMGSSIYKRDGYFAGTDQQRAADLNQMFANPKIKAIFELRGGWGSARILPFINYQLIRMHPKILIGFSDITTLLIAIYHKTHLVTFHGPLAIEPWPRFSVDYMEKVLFAGKAISFKNPIESSSSSDLVATKNHIQVIQSGSTTGVLIGGNLSVLVALMGTQYEPDWNGKILFVEDVNEKAYQIDRMMAQLQLAGVFGKIKGFIFGQCSHCLGDYGRWSIKHILIHYLKPYHIPAFMGAMIGHQSEIFTLPEGVKVTMNANTGTITMLHPAVR